MCELGVMVPIIPGIMPITNYSQILRFSRVCGANIPGRVVGDLETIQNDHDAVQQYGIALATRSVRN